MQSARYSCHILMKLEFSRQIFENTQISNFMKICSVGAEMFHEDGRADITKLIIAFRNFANAPKNLSNNTQNCPQSVVEKIYRLPRNIGVNL